MAVSSFLMVHGLVEVVLTVSRIHDYFKKSLILVQMTILEFSVVTGVLLALQTRPLTLSS